MVYTLVNTLLVALTSRGLNLNVVAHIVSKEKLGKAGHGVVALHENDWQP